MHALTIKYQQLLSCFEEASCAVCRVDGGLLLSVEIKEFSIEKFREVMGVVMAAAKQDGIKHIIITKR